MKRLLAIGMLLALGTGAASASAAGERAQYSQSYAIFIKGDPAGTETVVEKRGESGDLTVASEHDILIADGLQANRMTFATTMVFPKNSLDPSSYSYRYTTGGSGDSFDVTISGGQITRRLSRGGQNSEAAVAFTPNMVILDFNVYHQYDYVMRRYDAKKGGRQVFANFLPVIGNDIPLAITALGDEILKGKTGDVAVKNYRVELLGTRTGTVSMDAKGRLVRLVMPAQDLEVWRKDLVE